MIKISLSGMGNFSPLHIYMLISSHMYGLLCSDLGINLDFINTAYLSSYNSGVQMWPLIGIKMAGCDLVCTRETWWTLANVPRYNQH